MAPAYNTIPAAADEQDSLLASKKDTTKLKRLVAGAAVASLLLFESGNCIKDVGDKTLYYFLKADGVC